MYFFGFAFLLLGFVIIANPAFLAYIVAMFFIVIGVQMLAMAYRISQIKQKNEENSGFSFGGYEIIKKKK